MTLVAIPVGLLIGLTLGALGGGGSILTVPALVYLLGQSAHEATAGSLIIVGLTALTGMIAHHRGGRVRLGAGVTFGLLGVAGSYIGTRASTAVAADTLLLGFAGLMLAAAAAMLHRQRSAVASGAGGRGGSGPPDGVTGPLVAKMVATATAVGFLTGFFGVGGGFVIVPALVLALGFDLSVAVGTSLLVISINSAVAFAARLGTEVHLNWGLLAVFTAAAMAGSLVGNRVAARVRPRVLTVAFAGLLVGLAGYIVARTLPNVL